MKTAIHTLLRTSVATTLALVGAEGRAAPGPASDKCIVTLEARPERPTTVDGRPCPVAMIVHRRPRLDG